MNEPIMKSFVHEKAVLSSQLIHHYLLDVSHAKTFLLQNKTVRFFPPTWRHMSFCQASEPSSCTVSVKSSCSSTPEGIFLSLDTRSPQTSSIFWLILQCHDPGYGILPCYSVPIEKTQPKNHLKGAKSRFVHVEKFSLRFSSSLFVIRVNLLHP